MTRIYTECGGPHCIGWVSTNQKACVLSLCLSLRRVLSMHTHTHTQTVLYQQPFNSIRLRSVYTQKQKTESHWPTNPLLCRLQLGRPRSSLWMKRVKRLTTENHAPARWVCLCEMDTFWNHFQDFFREKTQSKTGAHKFFDVACVYFAPFTANACSIVLCVLRFVRSVSVNDFVYNIFAFQDSKSCNKRKCDLDDHTVKGRFTWEWDVSECGVVLQNGGEILGKVSG